ncbi:MAG: patatin-like phospholipase family protein [Bacteroidales bacterium]|nr:patatin-like phospholipase family protein [Bacteroidales bacterium]
MIFFTNNSSLQQIQEELRAVRDRQKIYSDIIDEDGHQYVDLVQEGGGVLGIALLGYTWLMEQAGIRFFSLAGTSAGAINSMMMAVLGRPGEAVSGKTLQMLHEKDLAEIMDGDQRISAIINRFISNNSWKYLHVVRHLHLLRNAIRRSFGLNPGHDFYHWIDSKLKEQGINTLSDLNRHRSRLPLLIDRNTGTPVKRAAELCIIASDITTKSKVSFPEMAELYWHDAEQVNPACFVRASMSIPFFFEPYVVRNIPGGGSYEDSSLTWAQSTWRRHTGFRGRIPRNVHFVDGGMLSNFPINAFHRPGVPAKPTFGARLSTWRREAIEIDSIGRFCGALVSTMRQLHDYDFLLRHRDYKHLICSIDCDAELDQNGNPKYNILDFNISDEKKIALFNLGASKALEFLKRFDWLKYKEIRSELSQPTE